MALSVNVIDRCGPSNKMRRKLQSKKTKAVISVYIPAKDVLSALHY